MISREEAFKLAVEQNKKELQKAAERAANKGKNNYYQKDPVHWCVMPEGGVAMIRLLGMPIGIGTPRISTDPKVIHTVKALCDDDHFGNFIIPAKEENPNHIYWKIWNLVMAVRWEKTASGDNKAIPIYESKFPTIYNRVNKNNRTDTKNEYEHGMKSNKAIVMNVIDYRDYAWHQQNKHTACLSKKASQSKDGKNTYYDIGVPQELYQLILNSIVQYYGPWYNYQVAVKRNKIKPFYEAWHVTSELNKVLVNDPNIEQFVVNTPITEEEASWEMYDLDKEFPISPNKKWLTRLGTFIQQIDAMFGKTLYNDLKQLVELEDREKGEVTNIITTENNEVKPEPQNQTTLNNPYVNNTAAPIQTVVNNVVSNPIVNNPTPVNTPVRNTRVAPPVQTVNANGFNIETYNNILPFLKEWTPEWKAKVSGFDAQQEWDNYTTHKKEVGVFTYTNTPYAELAPCPDCGYPFHIDILECPKCGLKFKSTNE